MAITPQNRRSCTDRSRNEANMTGSECQRSSAARPPSGSPTGAVPPPPPSQVEGRTRRPTGLRWGLRTVLVGGVAGVAWLPAGAAPHAAGHSTPAEAASGLSVVSLANGLGN